VKQQLIPSPWLALPGEIAPLMRREIPDLAAEMVREISRRVAEYDRPGDAEYRHTIQRGVEMALREFVGRVSQGDQDVETAAEVHRAIGRAERRAGRSLDALHAAYRVGARLSWRRWAKVSTGAGVPPAQIYRIADAVFAHIDELAEHAAEGYASVAGGAGDRGRQRVRLVRLLLGAAPASDEQLMDAARAARWRLPERLVALAVEVPLGAGPLGGGAAGASPLGASPLGASPLGVGSRIPADVLTGHADGRLFLLASETCVEEVPGWFPEGTLLVAGPVVPPGSARDSLQLAQRCLDLARRGLVERPASGVLRSEPHLATVILLENEAFARMLIERHLAPLRGLTPRQQERMVETLLASLSSRTGAPAVAELLDLHPQTVRYRLRRAESLFGKRICDPEGRLEFEMALRAHQLLNPPRAADSPVGSGDRMPG
jgi:hypothetical protein